MGMSSSSLYNYSNNCNIIMVDKRRLYEIHKCLILGFFFKSTIEVLHYTNEAQ